MNTGYGFCQCGCGEQTEISKYTDRSHGYVKGEPRRYKRGHQTAKPQEWKLVDTGYETPCHIWVGGKSGKYGWARGYGHAHKLFWEQENGPVPEGMVIHHLCHQPSCVNVSHMQLKTLREHRLLHPEARRDSDLSDEDIALIRAGGLSLREVAKLVGISKTHAGRVRRGESPKGR